MSDSIATWQVPSDKVRALVKEGSTTEAIYAYRAQDHRLRDGTPVRPPPTVVKAMLTMVKMDLWRIPLAITEEHARLYARP